jgi:pimeloyl-ACP methyl ester carboxylesterase
LERITISSTKILKTSLEFNINMDVYYKLTKQEGPLITLVHGLGEDHSIFNRQTDYLQNLGYSTLTYDLRGHGKSELKENISISSHAQDLETILQKENIKKTNLVGFSLGASVALEYTHQHPEKVNKLCIINPGIYNKNFFTKKLKLVNLFLKPLEQLAKMDKNLRKKLVDLSKTPVTPVYFALLYSLRNTSLTGIHTNLKAMKEYDFPAYLSEIETQTLILISKKDELIKQNLSQYLHKQLPNSELTVLSGNHLILLSNSEKINEELSRFLE